MWIDTTIQRPEAVYKNTKTKGLVIVGFPANNFASQNQDK
jgi:glutathione peroxidase-family protein